MIQSNYFSDKDSISRTPIHTILIIKIKQHSNKHHFYEQPHIVIRSIWDNEEEPNILSFQSHHQHSLRVQFENPHS